MKNFILAINPGSTSTKIAVYEDHNIIFEKTIRHTESELSPYTTIAEQYPFRRNLIMNTLADEHIDLKRIAVIVGRGGLVKPIESGVYEVSDAMKLDLTNGVSGSHASNLGGLIASDIAESIGVKAYIADPVVVDELDDVARVSGHPAFKRRSIFHALNQKAVSRIYAAHRGMRYEDLNLIVAHMGGGISVGAHRKGRVVDVNNALDGEGTFSPERSGSLPTGDLVKMCFSGKYSYKEVFDMLVGQGGVVAHLGTKDIKDAVSKAIDGESRYELIIDAMCYGVSKQIGEMAAVLNGEVDEILLTGGIAYSDYICERITKKVKFIAPITVLAGEDEMEALALNGLRVLQGEISPKNYE